MKVSELPVGETIYLGQKEVYSGLYDIVWIKVDTNNGFLTQEGVAYFQMDAEEICNSSRERRAHGSNFFPQTNIAQWLNSSEKEWYKPQHDTDTPPRYGVNPGFLSHFDNDELSAIVPHEVTVVVPEGFRREFGRLHHYTCNVSIPAYSQIYHCNDTTEGDMLDYFMRNNVTTRFMTRTAAGSRIRICDQDRSNLCSNPSSINNVCPYIRLNGDTILYDDVDKEGVHIVKQSEENLNRMHNALMELFA